MTILEPYITAIKGFEGFAPSSQWDYKQHSIGYGTVGRPGETISREEADRRLRDELAKAQRSVNALGVQMTPGQEAALTSLTYNAGPGWMGQGLGAAVKSGNWDEAARRFGQYTSAGGKTLPGLVNRRQAELSWMSGGEPNAPAQSNMMALGGPKPMQTPSLYSGMGPDDVTAARQLGQALMRAGMNTGNIRHWTQALGNVLQTGIGSMYQSQAAQGEREGQSAGNAALAAMLSGGDSAAALANPYVARQAQQIMLQDRNRQQEQADPMYQARLKAMRDEQAARDRAVQQNDAFRNELNTAGATSVPTEGAGRFAAPGLTGQQQTPLQEAFMQLPEAERNVARMLAAQDPARAAEFVMKAQLQRSKATGPQKKSVTELKQIYEAENDIPKVEQTIESLDRAAALISEEAEKAGTAAYEGYGAGLRGQLESRSPVGDYDKTRGKNTDEYQTLMSMEAIVAMANTLKGVTTDFELREFAKILADPSQPREIRRRTLGRLRGLAKKQLEINRKRAEEIRSGTYYSPDAAGAAAAPRVLDLGDGTTVEFE